MPKKSKTVAEHPSESPTANSAFWENLEAAERILEKMFPNESFLLRVTVPSENLGSSQVAHIECNIPGKPLYSDDSL